MPSATATPTARVAYDEAMPPDGLCDAARNGDLLAIQATADWYRDRGQPDDPDDPFGHPSDESKAYELEILRGEMESQQALGKNVRVMLEKVEVAYLYPLRAIHRSLNITNISELLSEHGFPVRVTYHSGWKLYDAFRSVYPPESPGHRFKGHALFCPTDHVQEEQTAMRLIAFLHLFFPRGKFAVVFQNETQTRAGVRAQYWCDPDAI